MSICVFLLLCFFVCYCFPFLPSSSPFFLFCIYYEFILAEDLCVHFPLLLISLSFSGVFVFVLFFVFVFCEGGFSSSLTLIFALGTKMYFCPLVGLDTFLVELARTEVSSEETVPSIFHGST